MSVRVLANLTNKTNFSRNSFSNFKNVTFEFPEGDNKIFDPSLYLNEDGIVIAPKGKYPNGDFKDNNIERASTYPFASAVPGNSGGLMDWDPVATDIDDVEEVDDVELWFISEYVAIPHLDKPIYFSMLPLDDGYMLFCLKYGAVRYNFTKFDGTDEEVLAVRGDVTIRDNTLFTTFDSESLPFATEGSHTYDVILNSFISGTIKSAIKKRKIRSSASSEKKMVSLDIFFTPKTEYSARLDNGAEYKREVEELRLRELKEAEERARQEEETARILEERRIKAEMEAQSKQVKGTARKSNGPKVHKEKVVKVNTSSSRLLSELNLIP